MTKIIGVLIIVLVIWGGYELFLVWDEYDKGKDIRKKEAEAASRFTPEQLAGLPQPLESSLQAAQKSGANGLKKWLKFYDNKKVTDPRRAWIELDYVVLVGREDPAEARRVFAEIKNRTTPESPVYERVKQLGKTYE